MTWWDSMIRTDVDDTYMEQIDVSVDGISDPDVWCNYRYTGCIVGAIGLIGYCPDPYDIYNSVYSDYGEM